ncbi:PEP/pyruvate-binding domain-containing protein [Longispora sp. NPDC051575]|uniref:PEP/pyruvate-binding domain-containing protein n=1 Tax=Longispora sp. NPDC051575 TaxID=3154943 RepID=UPI0034499524
MVDRTATEETDAAVRAVVGERLTLEAFDQLAGRLSGHSFVKLVVDRPAGRIHFLSQEAYGFHAYYIAEEILHIGRDELEANVDAFNQRFYHDPDRDLYLGLLALHTRVDAETGTEKRFFSLETVEVDTMTAEMLRWFHRFVREHVDPALPLLFKPATHLQEQYLAEIPAAEVPRISAHELFSDAPFVALQPGVAEGRLRAFRDARDYDRAEPLEWYDIIAMERVPDDIPRLAGIINARHTTPLSHTNVLAAGWQIPNAIQLDVLDRIADEGLDGKWVRYEVTPDAEQIGLTVVDAPAEVDRRPAWVAQRVLMESPEVLSNPIVSLAELRTSDRYRYGTKAANLGELQHLLAHRSDRLLGFYQVPRPPRDNLLPYLEKLLGAPDLLPAAHRLLNDTLYVPRGIALPFSLQREFLESSPRIQQTIGKLKMALELDAHEVDALALELQRAIRATRMPEPMRRRIDGAIVGHLGGVGSFVVRSSSNAEDLAGFSAAGIYESVNQVTTADQVVRSVTDVWASLLSPRSVRLRQQAGISLDDAYMGVVIQEEVAASMGGVLVTTNPLRRADFRNVYVNLSEKSVGDIVSGTAAPMQYLFNTVEGGGRTLSLGDADRDLGGADRDLLGRLAVAGRLLQAHFSPDYTFAEPVDIEWVSDGDRVAVVQLRPYAS